ncbi:hypothetical protein ACP4OV_012854 [Aristida adscensionis]
MGSPDEGGGSWGPLIGILIAIAALTAASVAFGQLCVGRRAFMRTGYDVEGYVMRKFSTCLGVTVADADVPERREDEAGAGAEGAATVESSEPPQESEEDDGGRGANPAP